MKNEAAELLRRSRAPRVLLDIAEGATRPPLTDYDLLPVPEGWDIAIPAEVVSGHRLLPIFCDRDKYTLYCVDRDTLEIMKLDIEDPWPPLNTFKTWQGLAEELLRMFEENEPDAVSEVRRLFADGQG